MAVINMKPGAFEKIRGDMGDLGLARHIGMDRGTVWRIRKGIANPGDEFVASVLKCFPQYKFEDLFVSVD